MRTELKQAAPRAGKQGAPARHAGPGPPERQSPLASLQRNFGNQAFLQTHRLGPIQAELKIGASNDRFEQEADRVADQVMRMALPGSPGLSEAPRGVQRSCAACAAGGTPCAKCRGEEEIQLKPLAAGITPLVQRQELAEEDDQEETIQTKAAPGQRGALGGTVDRSVAAAQGGGQPLPAGARAFFEPRFGASFGAVRVHHGAQAAEAARALGARAYTLGHNVVFGQGEYRPDSSSGKRLMGHELAHVVQQGKAAGRHRATAGQASPSRSPRVQASHIQRQLSPSPLVIQRACRRAIRAPKACTGLGGDILDFGATSDDIYLCERECDHFLPGEEARLSGKAASRLSPGDSVTVHGFASEEGDPTFNQALSCARANTAEGVLQAAVRGGAPLGIDLFSHGATPGGRADRRSVVIEWPSPPLPACGPDASDWFVRQVRAATSDPAVLAIRTSILTADGIARTHGTTARAVAEGGAATAVVAQETRMGSTAPPRNPVITGQVTAGTRAGVGAAASLVLHPVDVALIGTLIAGAGLGWRGLVNHGARYDFKAHTMSSPTTANCPDPDCRNTITLCPGHAAENCYITDLPGNLFFALIGRFVGWSELTLQLGSQLAQLTGTGAWDPRQDTAAIRLGFHLPLPLTAAGLCAALPGARSTLTARSGCEDCVEPTTAAIK